MKRFYKDVTLGGGAADGGYTLLLDGKAVQTPARQELRVSAMPWAEKIAEEWRAQKEDIVPDTMPLSQMAMTLIDRVVPQRAELAKEMFHYLDTDLICYRAVEPEMVRHAQEEKWDPFLDWFEQNAGIHLSTTTGLTPLVQSPLAHERVVERVARMTDVEFMAAYLVTIGSGSVVMALAFVAGDVSPEQVLVATFAEEQVKDKIYLADQYGVAPDQERRYRALAADLEALQEILMLCSATI